MLKTNETTIIKKMHQHFNPEFAQLKTEIQAYHPDLDVDNLTKAYEFGLKAHMHQRRYSGEPYFEHCLNVALILAGLRMDTTTIISGLLHDVVEDTDVTEEELISQFGDTVGMLVNGVTKISSLKFMSKETRQAETFRKMLLSMADDIRVIIIKFADRLHNMRTLEHVPEKKRPRIALETRDVYAPLAHRLGIARIKDELEDLAFKHLDTKSYTEIVEQVTLSEDDRHAYIDSVTKPVSKELKKNNIDAEIYGRPKTFSSIYSKMQRRQRPFEEIYDLMAIRIIVDKLEECYYALGLVHSLFMPVYDRFKDYIAMPKINGYQSLHTTVIGTSGKMVEIQIRTKAMHQLAENGIAAHWKYKEGIKNTTQFEKHISWVRDLLERQITEEDAGEFMEDLKIDLFQDEVFVFSPRGDLYKLPRGSTPIDFAYGVHTNIGNQCIAAKINGKIAPLRTKLKSGQQVEIITSQNQKPSQDWLSYIKTSKARHWIKKIVREEQQAQTMQIGDEILLKYLKKHKLNYGSPQFLEIIPKLGYQNIDNLKVAIGSGEVVLETIAKKLFPEDYVEERSDDNFFGKFLKRARSASGISVQGVDNMLIHFAKCCQPVPGYRIIGYLTKGKGVTVHRTDCNNMVKLYEEKERIIEVSWDIEKEQKFEVHLSILGEDRKNLLKDITLCVAKQDINIINVSFRVEDSYAKGNLDIQVNNLQHLTRIINSIRKVAGVLSVERVENQTHSTLPSSKIN